MMFSSLCKPIEHQKFCCACAVISLRDVCMKEKQPHIQNPGPICLLSEQICEATLRLYFGEQRCSVMCFLSHK